MGIRFNDIELIMRENKESFLFFKLFDSITEKYSFQSVDLHQLGNSCQTRLFYLISVIASIL
jgi:hypothetical protein